MNRSLSFRGREQRRYWWHQDGRDYVPPIYSFLTDEEWEIMKAWFDATDDIKASGEIGVPVMSVIQGLLMGSAMRPVVEVGGFLGYSALLTGFMFRHMGYKEQFISLELKSHHVQFMEEWVRRADLQSYVQVMEASGTDPKIVETITHLLGAPAMVVLDAVHSYDAILQGIDLWYDVVRPGGFVLSHDTSASSRYPGEELGGPEAIEDWKEANRAVGCININREVGMPASWDLPRTFLAPAGLTIIQKPFF